MSKSIEENLQLKNPGLTIYQNLTIITTICNAYFYTDTIYKCEA